MIFGDRVRAAGTVEPTRWIGRSCRGDWGTVGGLVPNRYESLVRVHPPAPGPGDWWSTYRDLYEIVASIGQRHTSSPHRAFFAIWEGHGFGTATSHVAWRDPPVDDEDRRARDSERTRLREEDRGRNAAIGTALGQVPSFDRPGRTYYLVEGPVMAVSELRYPGGDGWRNPDLFWPDDRRWFVGTDVDFWSLYVGGPSGFIAELARSIPTRAEPVVLDLPLAIED